MNDEPNRLRPLRAVMISLLWPWAMGTGFAAGAEPPLKAQMEKALDADGDGLK